MKTMMFYCGCYITSTMFGDCPLVSVSSCFAHSNLVQVELKQLADAIIAIERPPQLEN